MMWLRRAYGQYHFLFFLALFFLSSQANPSPSSSSTTQTQLCSEEEAAALIQFKTSFSSLHCDNNDIRSYPKTESWKEGTDCCSWDGITCDNNTRGRQVISLDLSYNCLYGNLSSNSTLFRLRHLRKLNLAFNSLSGQLPLSLGNLSQLTELSLSNNNFSGQIPPTLTNLTQLEELSLDHNQLEGSIPDDDHEVTAFPNLTSLSLSSNLLNGTLPSWLFTASSLWSLHLSHNLFSVVEDDMFSKLQSLSILDLSYNPNLSFISSSTSADYNTLPNDLLDLDLACCNITEFPQFLKGSTSLFYLNLSYNRIHGRVPEWMWDVGKDSLTYLDLSHNSLTQVEQIPWEGIEVLELSSNLIHGHLPIPPPGTMLFRISNNSLSGEISPLICSNGSYLEIVDLSHNSLSGEISSLVCNESFLRSLDLSHNSLSGEISPLICNATSLEVLDLSHNSLTGVVPHCLGNFSNGLSALNRMMNTHGLSTLNLGMNNLYGVIPPSFAKNCQLTFLNLNGNQFEGPLPRSIRNCRELQVLDLGNNKINGTFPHWLASLPNLQALVLKSNEFHGSITTGAKSKHCFSKIQIFDLSSNYFGGPLPVRYMKNFKAMMNLTKNASEESYMGVWREYGQYFYKYSIEISMKGQGIQLLNIFTMLTTIDLSNNKFRGEIPAVIGKLNSLKGLNLSHNNLSGYIPSSIGDLVSLEWLDLSSNKLAGTIPERLVDVTSLSFLNLSENQLHGQIPQGKQFNTFGNDSYGGNIGLCGFPVSKGCSNNEPPPPNFPEENDDSNLDITFGWKVVAIGYGCGLVISLAVGYVVFQTGKPKCFVTLVEDMQHKRPKKPKIGNPNGLRRRIYKSVQKFGPW